jgi:hypothetical protein
MLTKVLVIAFCAPKTLLKLEKAGMRDVAKIPPKRAPSKRELGSEAVSHQGNQRP